MILKKLEQVLFFLVVLLLPTQLGRHFWPSFSYIYSLRIDYLSPTIYLWDLLMAGLMVVFSLSTKKINTTALKLILLFLVSQFLSLLPHLTETNVLGVGLARLEEYLFVSFFGLYLASQSLTTLKKVVPLPLMLAISGEAVLAILQFFKGGTLGLWVLGERTFDLSTAGIAKFDLYGQDFLRPYASFPHPNVLAAFMLLGSLILAVLTVTYTKKQLITSLAAVLTTILTVSRVVILAGFVAALVLLNKKWRIILLLAVVILSPVLFTRFASTFNFDSLSLVRREELSQVALRIWQVSPMLGVGLNNFIPYSSTDLLAGPSRFLQPAHNIYLLSLAETGILGLAGLLIFLGYPIYKIIKLGVASHRQILLIWAAILLMGMFDHYFLTLPQGYRLLLFAWGISFAALNPPAVVE